LFKKVIELVGSSCSTSICTTSLILSAFKRGLDHENILETAGFT